MNYIDVCESFCEDEDKKQTEPFCPRDVSKICVLTGSVSESRRAQCGTGPLPKSSNVSVLLSMWTSSYVSWRTWLTVIVLVSLKSCNVRKCQCKKNYNVDSTSCSCSSSPLKSRGSNTWGLRDLLETIAKTTNKYQLLCWFVVLSGLECLLCSNIRHCENTILRWCCSSLVRLLLIEMV